MSGELATQTHIAGVDVTVGSRLRQRCSWCGALLHDYDLDSLARPLEDGEDPDNVRPWRPALWKPGELVRVAGGSSIKVDPTSVDGEDWLPPDACGSLDHEVTA